MQMHLCAPAPVLYMYGKCVPARALSALRMASRGNAGIMEPQIFSNLIQASQGTSKGAPRQKLHHHRLSSDSKQAATQSE
eukprot:1038111-Pelagomonas_calceolata.AAC.1